MNPRVYLLALGTFASDTIAFMVAGILPAVAGEVGTAGGLMTVFSLTFGLGSLLLAVVTAAFARRRALPLALSGLGLANVGAALLSPTFASLEAWIAAAGICAALYAPIAYAASGALASTEKQCRALSVVVLGTSVATVLGVPLGAWVGHEFGWEEAFGLVAAVSGVAVMMTVGLPEIPSPPQTDP